MNFGNWRDLWDFMESWWGMGLIRSGKYNKTQEVRHQTST